MIIFHDDSVTIEDCHLLGMADISNCIDYIYTHKDCPDCVRVRSRLSLTNEIMAHALLYKCGLWPYHTKDVDLDDERLLRRFCYFLLSLIWRVVN